jgi:penicillin-binding protein 1A
MQDVVRYGTAARAGQLGRSDLAGKTGTTNDARDTWFAGYTPDLVAISWMGYDQPRSLGRGETGAQTALPVWIKFMDSALNGVPQKTWAMPSGIVTARIDPNTGKRLPVEMADETTGQLPDEPASGMMEHFYQEFLPAEGSAVEPGAGPAAPAAPAAPATPADPSPAEPGFFP